MCDPTFSVQKCSRIFSNSALHTLTRQQWPERGGPEAVWSDSIVKLRCAHVHAAGCVPSCAQHQIDAYLGFGYLAGTILSWTKKDIIRPSSGATQVQRVVSARPDEWVGAAAPLLGCGSSVEANKLRTSFVGISGCQPSW